MALDFNSTKGAAASKKVDAFEYKDGENTVRLVGGVLPRYVYWVKGTNNKDIPIECLAFSRDKEKFDNLEVDHVQDFYPEAKCSWAYSINCLDPKDGKVKVLQLKKKLFAQIRDAAADLGDPTDLDDGWDVVFKKTKTGPLAYNVEYTLSVLRCKKRKLSEDEKAVVAVAETIDTKYPRATPEEVLALLNKIKNGNAGEDAPAGTDQEAVNELG
jgi:hypothetical protein